MTPPSEVTALPGKAGADKGFRFTLLDEPRPLPELRFLDNEEYIVRLADFRGRRVLLNIWATWCGPCREEMPSLDRLQAALGSEDFVVVPLSIDLDGLAVVREFYAELGLEQLGIYIDEFHMAVRALGVIGIPTTLLIDPQGREIARKAGPAEWDSPEVVAAIRQQLDAMASRQREPGLAHEAGESRSSSVAD
ncbi:MAG: TlpA family protein disulfide reductase [Gammaproteobacteria bacterium]|nr:TlpA family protein disulfide reductase [Gammaproteobacteria bacterium]NIR85968.1 TlpA family protein disulfide reductase [Gammaproteobacteria bacterium]NIR91959.1 TlpA family protein disulfide reductase [Gammaproteobacteria bacterium]NIU07209.1 TlpA family protein disulfide reductase [Gammaproteobacteria bacterium]NIV74210.1 redoxin family protein [Gammaproteobacteria bacterium]